MKRLLLPVLLVLLFVGCKKEASPSVTVTKTEQTLVGEWDNFQQVWLENTDTELHRVAVEEKHAHYHLSITSDIEDANAVVMEIREGRNGKNSMGKQKFSKDSLLNLDGVQLRGDTLSIKGLAPFDTGGEPHKFIRTRTFSGWIQYPLEQYGDSVYFQRGLMIHDQGGMAALDIEGVDYTVELTQLVYGKRIKLMKIAIYDMPLDSVGINSKSISYAWTSPEARRLGINLRKIVSGWTLVEPEAVAKEDTTTQKQ